MTQENIIHKDIHIDVEKIVPVPRSKRRVHRKKIVPVIETQKVITEVPKVNYVQNDMIQEVSVFEYVDKHVEKVCRRVAYW